MVRNAGTRKHQKIVGRSNGSQANPPHIQVDFARLLLAPLHIVLGVTKKIWNNLIVELQAINCNQDSQRKNIICTRDFLLEFVKEIRLEGEAAEILIKEAEQRVTVLNDLLTECRNQNPVNYADDASL